jgi:integrase
MTLAEIDTLIARWMDTELQKTEDIRAQYHFDDEQREVMVDLAIDKYEDSALYPGHAARVIPEADALLKVTGLPPVDHDSVDFKRLCRRLSLAQPEVLGIELERWQNIYHTHPRAATAATAAPVTPPSPLFSAIVEKFLAETPRAARTAGPVKVELLKFIAFIGGDRPLSDIMKADGRRYKEHLLNDRKLGMTTVSKHLSAVGAVLRWADQQGYVSVANPIKGLVPSKKIVRKLMTKRRPFTDKELLTVFGSKEFLEQRTTNPARYWIPLMCLFQICRREEGAQLAVSDIQEEHGVMFLNLTDDEALLQNLKNEGSKRRVPVHSALIQLGFLDYVDSIREAGHARIFPTLTKGNSGYADPAGKWFGRLLTKLGIVDKGVVMHSLRHGGITKLHAAGCHPDHCEMLAGHVSGNEHGRYVHRELIDLKVLRDGLERLTYPGVLKALQLTYPEAVQALGVVTFSPVPSSV